MVTFSARPEHRWLYPCRVLRVVDGDGLVVLLDRGFHDYAERAIRLEGVNAPELKLPGGVLNPPGQAARAWVIDWLSGVPQPEGTFPHILQSSHYEKYGRNLGILWRPDGACLNADLLAAHQAVPMKR